MATVTLFKDKDCKIDIPKEVISRLELLNLDVTIDLILEEIIFFYPNGEVFIVDFDENLLSELIKGISFDDNLVNDVEDEYFEEFERLQNELDSELFIYGQGYYQSLYIKIYDSYIAFHNIIIDVEDYDWDPDPDPDDGEPLPVPTGSSFFCIFIKKVIK